MSQFFRTLIIIFRKEWRDAIRDKRSLRLAFLMPIYFVGMFVGTFFLILHFQNEASGRGAEPIKLSVMGAQHLPPLMDWLKEQGVIVNQVDENIYAQVEQKKLDYALIIPPEAEQQYASGESAVAWLVFDATNNKAQTSLSYIRQQIMAWNARVGGLRLLTRGLAPSVAFPLNVRDMNVASDQKMGFMIMASLPMFLILSVFIGSVGFAADMTAGERERRSLESLLITPAQSLAIIAGKWLTCLMLTFAVLLLELGLLAIAFGFIPFNQLGLRVDVTVGDLFAIFVALTSLAVIAVSLQQTISIFARSFKDAQTYMSIMVFIPMLPLMYTMINPAASEPWFVWVPALGHQVVVKDLLLGGHLQVMALVKFWLVALPIAGMLLTFTATKLRNSNLIYG
jgi:sodium transport system permease protein